MLTIRRVMLPLLIAALTSPQESLSAADTLPNRIPDSSFWTLIEDVSEPGGTFESDNWVSNETGVQQVISRLTQLTKPGGVYIGVGPEQNFTYIAAIRPKIAFIIDIRRQNMLEHLIYKALFETSANRGDFVSRLFSRARPAGLTENATAAELFRAYSAVRADDAIFRSTLRTIKDVLIDKHKFALRPDDVKTIEHVFAIFREFGPGVSYSSGGRLAVPPDLPTYSGLMTATDQKGQERSYLASEDNYRFVRERQLANLIIPVIGDFGGPKTVRAVGRYLRDHGAAVTAFYVSNVESYLSRAEAGRLGPGANGGLRNFFDNVSALPLDSTSTFIRSWSGVFGPIPPGGMPYTVLSSMQEMVGAARDGRLQTFRDVISLSK